LSSDIYAALSPEEWSILALSLRVSLVAVAAILPVCFCIAWMLARWRFPGKLLVDALVHLPLVLPPVVTGWLLLLLFGMNGPIGRWLSDVFGIILLFRWTGAALAAAIMAVPLMVRAIRLSIEAIDTRLESAAATLGASRLRIFFTISLPLALPGVLAAIILGFARSLGEFGATITFVAAIPGETLTLPAAIYGATQSPGGEARAAALCLVAAVIAVGAVLVSDAVGRWAGRAARGDRR